MRKAVSNGEIMKQKLILISSYIKAFLFFLSGGLIVIMSSFNRWEAIGEAVKISQDPEYEFINRVSWGWHTEQGTIAWYSIACCIVFIISFVTAWFYRNVYSKHTFWLLSCALIPLGAADFFLWFLPFTFPSSMAAVLYFAFFLVSLVYFIITLVFLIKDIYKSTKALKNKA